MITLFHAPVVKWISRQASNLLLGVRIPPGAQNKDVGPTRIGNFVLLLTMGDEKAERKALGELF